MSSNKPRPWAELLQLVPVISLALPFILQGTVDLRRAKLGLLVAALLTIPVTAIVVVKKQVLNPILLGTALWLWLGAIAFNVPVPALADWVAQTQAFGLFVGALFVGVVATSISPQGYVGCPSRDAAWVRRMSLVLLAITGLCVGWAWHFQSDVRVGGGLPFIVLNVARRILCRQAPE